MKQYLLLLDKTIRTLLILIYRFSPTYESLLNQSGLNPSSLDGYLKKLEKKGIIFKNNNHYAIHPNFQKKFTKLIFGNLIKLVLLVFGVILNKNFKKHSSLHLDAIDALNTSKKKTR